MRYCYYCKTEKIDESFAPAQKKFHRGREVGRCRECTAIKNKEWRLKNLDKRAEHNRKRRENPKTKERDRLRSYPRRYGISAETYQNMRESQGYKCALCGLHEEEHKLSRWGNLCLDHDHKTGKVRALLCAQCNKGLGSFKDNSELLWAAAEYIEKYKI